MNSGNAVSQPKVQILVESLEHAKAINALCLTGPSSPLESRTMPTNRQTPERTIVTTTYAAHNGIDADILVRADGGTLPMRFKGFPRPADACHAGRLYLIDYDDDIHPRNWNINQHQDEYREKGWTNVTGYPSLLP